MRVVYFTLLLERDPQITYPDIIEKLEKRFGFQDVPEMSMIQFNNCKQDKHETLEDWADRVLSLANKAFRELPEAYMNRQATLRFGLLGRPLQFLLDEASSRALTGLLLRCSPIAFKLAIISFI
jgi:hypothetical protein